MTKYFGEDRMRWLCSEFDYRYKDKEKKAVRDVLDFVEEAADAVGTGQPHDVPGTWPMNIRQMFEEQDFYFRSGKIFKKRDPIVDAKDGHAGTDIKDADRNELDNWKAEMLEREDTRMFLEAHPELFIEETPQFDAMNFVDTDANPDRVVNYQEQGEQETEDEGSELNLDVVDKLDFVSMNSPFCGLGYRRPRDRYQYIGRHENFVAKEHSYRRQEHRKILLDRVSKCLSLPQQEKLRAAIMEESHHDWEIRQQWNQRAFQIDRAIYHDTLRRKGLDEETIRRKLFGAFDAVRVYAPKAYTMKNGKRVWMDKADYKRAKARAARSKDSIWNQARSEAYEELFLTYAQWSDVYKALKEKWIQLRQEANLTTETTSALLVQTFVQRIKMVDTLAGINKIRMIISRHAAKMTLSDREAVWAILKTRENETLESMRLTEGKAKLVGYASARSASRCKFTVPDVQSVDLSSPLRLCEFLKRD